MTTQEFTTDELNNEEWRPIHYKGYESLYSVSNLGRVRREGSTQYPFPRIMKPSITKRGYNRATIYRLGQGARKVYVHGLVAHAFIGACPAGEEVNHIRQPKSNNRVSNLEYLTHQENVIQAHVTGLTNPAKGERHGSRTHPERLRRGDRHDSKIHPERVRRGDRCYQTKIKDADIPSVFEMRSRGLLLREIASIKGVAISTVGRILTGRIRRNRVDAPYRQCSRGRA